MEASIKCMPFIGNKSRAALVLKNGKLFSWCRQGQLERRRVPSISWESWARMAKVILLLLASMKWSYFFWPAQPAQWLFFLAVEKGTSFSPAICTWWNWTKEMCCHRSRERNCLPKSLAQIPTWWSFIIQLQAQRVPVGVPSIRKWTSTNWTGTQRLNYPVATVGRPATLWGCWGRRAGLELLLSIVYLFGGEMTPFSSAVKLVPFFGTKLTSKHLWGMYQQGSRLKGWKVQASQFWLQNELHLREIRGTAL